MAALRSRRSGQLESPRAPLEPAVRDQVELCLGCHAALNRGARHLYIALGRVAVADAQQRTRHGNRQVQDRSSDRFLQSMLPPPTGLGGMVECSPGSVPGDARHAVERGYPYRVPLGRS